MEDDDQTRKSPIPGRPPIPDLAGKQGGNPRFPGPTRPESGIRKSPVSRFGRDRESRSRDRESGSRGRHAGDFLVGAELRIDWAAGCLGPGALVAMKGHGVARGQRGTGAVAQWLRGAQVALLASM
jgi:hypothetical protein